MGAAAGGGGHLRRLPGLLSRRRVVGGLPDGVWAPRDDVQRSAGGLQVQFTEKDGTASIPVEYHGTLPDIFQPGITVVAEGRLGADGIFHARAVLAKCPSRFATTPYTQ